MKYINKTFEIFGDFFRSDRKKVLILFLLVLIEGITLTATVISIIPLTDYLLDQTLTSPSVVTSYILSITDSYQISRSFWTFGLLFVFLTVSNSFVKVFIRYKILKIKYSILRGLYKKTLDSFLSARYSFFDSENHGKFINTLNKELSIVGDTVGHLATQFSQIVQIVLYSLIPFFIDFRMTLIAIIIAFFFSSIFLALNKYSYNLGKRNTETSNVQMGVLNEVFQSIRIILGFSRKKEAKKRYIDAFDNHVKVTVKSQVLSDIVPNFFLPLGIFGSVVAFGISLDLGGRISELSAVLWSLLSLMPVLSAFLQTNVSINNFIPSYEQLNNLLSKAEKMKEPSGNIIFEKLDEDIKIKDIFFSYPNISKKILNKLNLSIKKSEITAIIGPSGSGKSTLVDLILGLQRPFDGEILINNRSLNSIDIHSYREKIGYVPQESFLFNISIRENLIWSCPNSTENELWNALKLANIDKFICGLPNGIDTIVGDRGSKLSGGQKQRIALARAILRKPAILILDEATSSLDIGSEKKINESLNNIKNNTTVILIAHRLQSIQNADNVIVLSEGKFIDHGSYENLLERKNKFILSFHKKNN